MEYRLKILYGKDLTLVKKEHIYLECLKFETVKPELIHFVYKGLTKNFKLSRPSHYKSESAVKKTTRKPFPQKKTGLARQGTLKSISQKGGAVAFGYSQNVGSKSKFKSFFKINKKIKQKAFIYSLKNKIENSLLYIIENWEAFQESTKISNLIINRLITGFENDSKKILFIYSDSKTDLINVRNIKNCLIIHISQLNIVDIIKTKFLFFDVKTFQIFLHLRKIIQNKINNTYEINY